MAPMSVGSIALPSTEVAPVVRKEPTGVAQNSAG
jgi:hypothetical protein